MREYKKKTHVDCVIERTMLSDGTEDGCMVFTSVDGSHAENTRGKTTCDISRQDAVLCLSVQTLKEDEFLRIGRRSIGQGGDLLDDDVRVTLDLTLSIELLRRR